MAAAIAASFRDRLGRELIEEAAGSGHGLAEAMMRSSSAILCHDGAEDPRFVYVNVTAAALWKMSVEQMIGMPSRLSAPPELRGERAQALTRAATDGVLLGYSGERVASDGTRFVIEDATLWTVDLPGEGLTSGELGQAVVFDRWHEVPQCDSGEIVR